MKHRLKVGISACFFHADAQRPIFTGKTLQYVEQSIAHWVMSQGALEVMIPSPAGDTQRGDVTLEHYAQWLDGLVLEGGSDLWPGSYDEPPLRAQWSGDRIRDEYVNSVHHQAITGLADGFIVEARCPDDGLIEAVRRSGPSYVAAVQWHPEFHVGCSEPGLIDDAPLLADFLAAASSVRPAP